MKNNLDVIIATVVLVIALGVSGACYAGKRTVVKPTDPTPPPLTSIKMPDVKPAMDNGLGLSGTKAAGGPSMGARGGMPGGGMPGMPGGMPGGMMPPGVPGGPQGATGGFPRPGPGGGGK